jgi:hypothetical protein
MKALHQAIAIKTSRVKAAMHNWSTWITDSAFEKLDS